MIAANELAECRKKIRELVAKHQSVGQKFQAFAAPHRKACDEKLRRESFPPFLLVERAKKKAEQSQADVLKEIKRLEAMQGPLLERLDAEHIPGESPAEPAPEVADEEFTPDAEEAPGEPEFDPDA